MILRYSTKTWKVKNGEVSVSFASANVVEHSVADVSFLADLLVDKFARHIPLLNESVDKAVSSCTLYVKNLRYGRNFDLLNFGSLAIDRKLVYSFRREY